MRLQPINSAAFDWEILPSSYHLTAAAILSERPNSSGRSRVIDSEARGISKVIFMDLRSLVDVKMQERRLLWMESQGVRERWEKCRVSSEQSTGSSEEVRRRLAGMQSPISVFRWDGGTVGRWFGGSVVRWFGDFGFWMEGCFVRGF